MAKSKNNINKEQKLEHQTKIQIWNNKQQANDGWQHTTQ
jgi:hypothetical protein